MPYIPTYKRQVYASRTPQTAYKPIPESLLPKFDPKKGEVMLRKFELERRKSNQQMVNNVMQFGQQLFSVLGRLQQTHIATKIREAETKAKNTFDQLYQQFEYDPDYESFEKRFEKAQEKLYDDQTKDMGPAVRKAYESKFEGLKGKYETKVQGLVLEKDHAHSVASMNYQIAKAIETGDPDMLKRVLFGEDIVDRPKQPAASGAPMKISEWLKTPAGKRSKQYGATAKEIQAYLRDPDAAVKKYYTPTRTVGGQEKELSEEDYRRYLDAHARAYQKDAYLETGEPREAITSMHVPGAVENKIISREKALQINEEGNYTIKLQRANKALKGIEDPAKALEVLHGTDESGEYVFAPELREADRDDIEKNLTADLRELEYLKATNEKNFRSASKQFFQNLFFSGGLSYEMLVKASRNYERLDFRKSEHNPQVALHPDDAAKFMRELEADQKGGTYDASDMYEEIRKENEARFVSMIDSGLYGHHEIDGFASEARENGALSPEGYRRTIDRNESKNPDEVLAGYMRQIDKSPIDSPAALGKFRAAFHRAYSEREGEWTTEELDKLFNTLMLPHAEKHLSDLAKEITGTKARMYQGDTSFTGRKLRDMEELDDYETVAQAASEGYFRYIPKDQLQDVQPFLYDMRGKQLEWYDLMVDDSGFKRNWYAGAMAPRKNNYMTEDHRLVVVDEDDNEWTVIFVDKTEQWVHEHNEPIREGSVRLGPYNEMFAFIDGHWQNANRVKVYLKEYGMGMVKKYYAISQHAEETTGDPRVELDIPPRE